MLALLHVQVGGPGGLLRVMVLNASNLCPPGQQQQAAEADSSVDALRTKSKPGSKPSSASAPNTVKLSSYCEVTFGQTVLRTPITHHAGASLADWNWQFSLALPCELDKWPGAASGSNRSVAAREAAALQRSAGLRRSSGGGVDASNELNLAVYDAQTVGQPVLLGKTKVRVLVQVMEKKRQLANAICQLLPAHQASSLSSCDLDMHMCWGVPSVAAVNLLMLCCAAVYRCHCVPYSCSQTGRQGRLSCPCTKPATTEQPCSFMCSGSSLPSGRHRGSHSSSKSWRAGCSRASAYPSRPQQQSRSSPCHSSQHTSTHNRNALCRRLLSQTRGCPGRIR